jgi:flagellar protein FlgJ
MFRSARRLLIGPLLAVCASGTFVAVSAGAASADTITATVTGSTVYRTQASESSEGAGEARANTRVSISCKVNGQYVRGNVRKTTQWDRLTNGKYLSHGHVDTSKKIPACPPTNPATPTPTAPAGPLTTVSNAAFLAAAAGPAQASQREFNVPASVTLAQAILESGWGKSKLSMNDRNYFGMKCFGNPGGIAVSCHDYVTQECDKVTQTCFTTTASFRVYNSPTDSFRDHGRQLSTLSRYAGAFSYAKQPNQFAAEIHKAGYATDLAYTDKLVALMGKYNLYQYDLP